MIYGIDYYFTGSNQQIRASVGVNNEDIWVNYNTTDDMTGSFYHVVFTHTPNSSTGVKLYIDSELKIQKDTIKQLNKHWKDKDINWNYEHIKIK